MLPFSVVSLTSSVTEERRICECEAENVACTAQAWNRVFPLVFGGRKSEEKFHVNWCKGCYSVL